MEILVRNYNSMQSLSLRGGAGGEDSVTYSDDGKPADLPAARKPTSLADKRTTMAENFAKDLELSFSQFATDASLSPVDLLPGRNLFLTKPMDAIGESIPIAEGEEENDDVEGEPIVTEAAGTEQPPEDKEVNEPDEKELNKYSKNLTDKMSEEQAGEVKADSNQPVDNLNVVEPTQHQEIVEHRQATAERLEQESAPCEPYAVGNTAGASDLPIDSGDPVAPACNEPPAIDLKMLPPLPNDQAVIANLMRVDNPVETIADKVNTEVSEKSSILQAAEKATVPSIEAAVPTAVIVATVEVSTPPLEPLPTQKEVAPAPNPLSVKVIPSDLEVQLKKAKDDYKNDCTALMELLDRPASETEVTKMRSKRYNVLMQVQNPRPP